MSGAKKIFYAAAAAVGLTALFYNLNENDTASKEDFTVTDKFWDTFTKPSSVEKNKLNRAAYSNKVRNPLDTDTVEVYEKTTIVKDSRTPVFLDDPKYDAVGVVVSIYHRDIMENGAPITITIDSQCTATVSEILGYENTSANPIILSAGHCFEHEDKDKNEYTLVSSTFHTEYIDESGDLKKFTSEINLNSIRYNNNDIDIESRLDIAIATLSDQMPLNFSAGIAIPDYKFRKGQLVTSAGFPGDKIGMQEDINCKIDGFYSFMIFNYCDVQAGASGGPLLVESSEVDFKFAGVLSGDSKDSKITVHFAIATSFLNQIPYLVPTSQHATNTIPYPSKTCVKVKADALNIRSGPNTKFNVVGMASKGHKAYQLDEVNGWSQVMLESGGVGFMSNKYLYEFKCK